MSTTQQAFADLGLNKAVTDAINELGYTIPSPIQAQTIPILLKNKDLVGQAQTGTGKTAAFALPLLSKINIAKVKPQALVLAPTRELALQVHDSFNKYAKNIKGFASVAVYGGAGFNDQLRALRNGVHVVVGTPGRIMDHMRRGSLDISEIEYLVLDEADEMLRMGFAEDVEWILQHTPQERQTVLFSATMPAEIRSIASQFMNNPTEVKIAKEKATELKIRQRYSMLHNHAQKTDALLRILEAEVFDAMIIFVRTKITSNTVADHLRAKGYACAALNGDVAQNQREQVISQVKSGKINIIVATDVAARGIDLPRISHVINFDIPHDIEAYIHRIGRTGRAGREGDTILFLSTREQRLMYAIEKATKQKIELYALPSVEDINKSRMQRFKQRIVETINAADLSFFTKLMQQYQKELDTDPIRLAAALAVMLHENNEFLLRKEKALTERRDNVRPFVREDRPQRGRPPQRGRFADKDSDERSARGDRPQRGRPPQRGRFADKDSDERSAHGDRPQRGRPPQRGRFADKDTSERSDRSAAKPRGRYADKDSSERSSRSKPAYGKPAAKSKNTRGSAPRDGAKRTADSRSASKKYFAKDMKQSTKPARSR